MVNLFVKLYNHTYYYVFFLFLRLAYLLGLYVPKKTETFLDMDHKYTSPLKTKFLATFDNEGQKESTKNTNYNENIDSIFYDKKAFVVCVTEPDNHVEKIWKTRIIFEYTARGNIIMFYDAYKLGFSFYCDQKVVSYDILNAAAMKYVTLFRCRDFFIDETITPPEKSSPFVKLYFTEEKKEVKEANDKKMENNPFAKLRNYAKENINEKTGKYGNLSKMVTKNSDKTTDEKNEKNANEPEKMKNKFLYLGKINNFTMTQFVEKKRKVLAKFTSPLLENIKIDANVQKEQISYKTFKNFLKTSKTMVE